MMSVGSKFKICELFGIPIYVNLTLIILLFLFATGGGSIAVGMMCAFMLLISITAHELGHALTARMFGYETNDITLSLLGGCASLIALPRKAWQEFATAIAGPVVSLALSFVGIVAIWLISFSSLGDVFAYVLSDSVSSLFHVSLNWGGNLLIRQGSENLVGLFLYLALMNAMLALFNLLPGFPLDGGRIFRSAMRNFMTRARATYVAMVVGRMVAVLIGIKGAFTIFNGGNWGFVTIMIAWMIWQEGYREYLVAKQEENFRNWTQADFNARVSPPPYD